MALQQLWNKLVKSEFQYTKVTDPEIEQSLIPQNESLEEGKISSLNSFWNICNSIQGVAILAMPYVIKGGGWWSVIAMVIVALISNYTGKILLKCHYEEVFDEVTGKTIEIRTRVSYADVAHSIWPDKGENIVLLVQVLELLFMATLYPIVAVSVLKALFSHLPVSSALWVAMFGVVISPNIFLRRLYHISLMSTVTVVSATFVFAAITCFCFTKADSWHVHNLDKFNLKEFVAAVGVIIASYSSQMYLSVIESDMKEPSKINIVMNAGFSAMTVLKVGIGVVAYMTFGDTTFQVVTLNLPAGVLLTVVNTVVLTLAVSSYTLPMFTVFEILEKGCPWLMIGESPQTDEKGTGKEGDNKKRSNKVEIRRNTVRIILVLMTLIMAISVPHFCLFLSFIGSFTGAFLEIVFPCLFYIILKYDKISKWTIALNTCLMVLSMLFMGTGMYFSAVAIAKAFKLHTKEIWTVE